MKDQFYTKDEIAKRCFQILCRHVNIDEYDVLLEPSAGKGAFFKLLDKNKRKGVDIEPKYEGIIKQDYFDFTPETNKRYLVIGNPPFGRVSSLAVRFFNKSAEFCDVIAFVLPRTFKRVSIQNQLRDTFHLIYSEDLPLSPCCFEPSMNAKCCFQVWTKDTDNKREKTRYNKTHRDFSFIPHGPLDDNGQPTPPDDADFVVRAYGGRCGEVVQEDLHMLRPKSWHWIKVNGERISKDQLKERFMKLDYSMSQDTVRQNSIGRQELVYLYEQAYGL